MCRASIRVRMMLWYTLLTVILLAVSLPALYGILAGSLRRDQEALLRSAGAQAEANVELEDGAIKWNRETELPQGTYFKITVGAETIDPSPAVWQDAPAFQPDGIHSADRQGST